MCVALIKGYAELRGFIYHIFAVFCIARDSEVICAQSPSCPEHDIESLQFEMIASSVVHNSLRGAHLSQEDLLASGAHGAFQQGWEAQRRARPPAAPLHRDGEGGVPGPLGRSPPPRPLPGLLSMLFTHFWLACSLHFTIPYSSLATLLWKCHLIVF